MLEITGDLFDYPVIVIPTNGIVKTDGRLVMGAGVALEAVKRFKDIDLFLGNKVTYEGNQCYLYTTTNTYVISFPTKNHYKDSRNLELIETSTKQLIILTNKLNFEKVYLPRVGCGLGNLDWITEVKPLLQRYLDDRFIIVTKDG